MIGSILGVVGSAIAGKSASDDAKDAQKKSIASSREADAENYRRALESIGAYGSALLPLYFTSSKYYPGQLENMSDEELSKVASENGITAGNLKEPLRRDTLIREIQAKTGQPFEKTLADNIMGLFGAAPSPEENLKTFEGIRDSLAPTQDATNQYVRDMFSGQMLDEELAELQPVAQARLNQAQAFEDAANQRLASQLNRQQAQFARKGYTGAGSASDRLEAAANRSTAQQVAGMRSSAELKNAIAELAARADNRKRQGANLGLPGTQLGAAAKFQTAPEDLASSALLRSMAPAMSMRRGAIPNVTKDPYEYSTNYGADTFTATAAARGLPKVFDYLSESGLFGGKKPSNPIDPNYMEGIDSPFAGATGD
mgnify:CR=1 FL=1